MGQSTWMRKTRPAAQLKAIVHAWCVDGVRSAGCRIQVPLPFRHVVAKNGGNWNMKVIGNHDGDFEAMARVLQEARTEFNLAAKTQSRA